MSINPGLVWVSCPKDARGEGAGGVRPTEGPSDVHRGPVQTRVSKALVLWTSVTTRRGLGSLEVCGHLWLQVRTRVVFRLGAGGVQEVLRPFSLPKNFGSSFVNGLTDT